MDNLHFLPNNILTRLFKVLKNYKNYYCRDKGPKSWIGLWPCQRTLHGPRRNK